VRVVAGDTLEAIAARTGSSVAALQQANPQVRPEALQVGQLLRLPPPRGMVQVAPGDTLEAIAARTGTSVAALQQANPQVRPEALQVGQWLQLPRVTAAAARSAAPTVVPAAASPGPDPKADPDAQAALLLSPGERRDRATLTLRERSGQCETLRQNWRIDGRWQGWDTPVPGSVGQRIVLDLCSNTLDGPAVPVPPPLPSG